VFTAAERDRVQELLLARAEADGAITGAAFTGSHATGDDDRWSDTDLGWRYKANPAR
jgi:predicted nucleotidyltransferase